MEMTKKSVMSPKGDITLYTLTNKSGASVTLSTLGAGIVSVVVPDRNGRMADVVLGYENAADYLYDGPCAGKVPGRYANRIARGHFSIDGHQYSLAINNGPNALHGGPEGFQNRVWDSEYSDGKVVFSYHSTDGEEGYPGNLDVTVAYTWSDDNALSVEMKAVTDAKTVVNLTNHAYFNLSGHDSGSVLNQNLRLAASRYLPTDDTLIPSGDIDSVTGTPMDFIVSKSLGRDIKSDFPALNYGKGYDNCWVIDDWKKGDLKLVAVLADDESGRVLEVASTQPAVQVYTGNWLDGCPAGKGGCTYHDYDGVAIECQGMPDAPNHENFPSQMLSPGEVYDEKIIFTFKNK